jgi:zinc protease
MRELGKFATIFFTFSAAILVMTSCGKKETGGGLTTDLLSVPDSPLVSIRIVLNVGAAHDPAGKEGLCQLTLSLLANGGSAAKTYEEIMESFYPVAAGVGLGVDKEMSVFTGSVHADNLEFYYGILKEMLLDPGFREDDFNRIKTNQINFLEKTLIGNMGEQFGKEILGLMLYDSHPYGHHTAGTIESLKSITLDDLRTFYRDHFLQGNVTIGLAGGYPPDFPDKVAEDFSSLPEGETPQIVLPAPREPQGLEVVIADKPTPATDISMGFPVSLSKADKDFFALWIANAHFGEHRQSVSWLFQKIREERGQNYGDYSYIEHFIQGRDKFPSTNYCRQQQYFSIWIRSIANSNRHFVIRQALRELKKFVEEGISEERFELVRTYLLNYTKLYAQTLSERIGWQIDSRYYGYRDFLAEAQKVLPKLSVEDVNRAIRKYLNFNNIAIAIVTEDAASLKEALVANAPSPVSYANPNMPQEILDEDLVIQSYILDITMDDVRVAPASEFFRMPGIPAK